jgi:hypothetical protein
MEQHDEYQVERHNTEHEHERNSGWLAELWRRTRPQQQRGILTMEPDGRLRRDERVSYSPYNQ